MNVIVGIIQTLNNGVLEFEFPHEIHLEPVCCKKLQKSPKQETGLMKSRPLEELNDAKLIVND